jgi:Icc-related predicted phosphoesterase
MKIQIVSDLHLEFSDINIKNEVNADVLILSGDIMIAQDLHDHAAADFNPYSHGAFAELGRKQQRVQRFRDFLKRCSFQFPHTFYVAGNHEFYNGKFFAGIDYLREECAKFPNVYFLERDTKVIDDVVFIGGTLWTDLNNHDPLTMQAIKDMMNDYRIIRNDHRAYAKLSPEDTALRHKLTKEYFKLMLSDHKESKCVIVGHHSPSKLSTHQQYANQYLMNGGYSSDMSQFILDHPQIKLWTHGHTHHPFDYMIGETRIVCNPRGYETEGYSEQSGWDPTFHVEI